MFRNSIHGFSLITLDGVGLLGFGGTLGNIVLVALVAQVALGFAGFLDLVFVLVALFFP